MKNIKNDKENDVSLDDYLAAKAELERLREENGIAPEEEGKISRLITRYFGWKDDRQRHRVKKSVYLWLAILLGWCGGHRFYEHRWILAIAYFALGVIKFPVLAGFPLAMTVIDILIVIPMEKDEEGYIII